LTPVVAATDTFLQPEPNKPGISLASEETAMMRAIGLKTVGTLLAAWFSAFTCLPTSARAETIEFAVWFSDRDFYAEHIRKWASEIDKRTDGRVKIKLHFSGALVAARETVNAVRTGAAGGGTTSASFVSALARPVSYFEALFWIPGEPKVALETVAALLQPSRALMEPRGLKLLFSFPSTGLVSNCSNGHVKSPADWKGKKVRAAGRWQGIQLRAVGASAVTLDPGEVYLALQNKTVDCILFLANLTLSSKVHEVAPHITYWRDGANASMYYLNLALWNKISAADQKVILDVSNEIVIAGTHKLKDQQEEALRELEKGGAKVYRATDAEISEMRKAMSPVYAELEKFTGAEGKPFADVILPLQK
jgi:TRAP-type C4-dicarboxylate transport system substrate-binding protein